MLINNILNMNIKYLKLLFKSTKAYFTQAIALGLYYLKLKNETLFTKIFQ